jgi:hypothetical protein
LLVAGYPFYCCSPFAGYLSIINPNAGTTAPRAAQEATSTAAAEAKQPSRLFLLLAPSAQFDRFDGQK